MFDHVKHVASWTTTTKIPIYFFNRNFGQKRPILHRCQKNFPVILDKLF